METIKVYSPVEDKNIRENLKDSPIWKQAFHEEELADAMKLHPNMIEYTIKFDMTKPVQLTKMIKVNK